MNATIKDGGAMAAEPDSIAHNTVNHEPTHATPALHT